MKNEKGEYQVAELTSQGLLIQNFSHRILYSRSHEIAVRKLCLPNSEVKKKALSIIREFANSNLKYKSSLISSFSITKSRQKNQLKLLQKRKRLEEVEFDLKHAKVSPFQKRSLDLERIQILQTIAKLQSLLENSKDPNIPIHSVNEFTDLRPMNSVEFVMQVYRALGLIQDEIDDVSHYNMFI